MMPAIIGAATSSGVIVPDFRVLAANPLYQTSSPNEIEYGNGMYVMVSSSGRISYSSDGINWTAVSTGTTSAFYGVRFGNGIFVAIGGGTNRAWTSSDGINWSFVTQPAAVGSRIYFLNGQFIIASTLVYTSTNGTTWTTLGSVGTQSGMAYGNGNYVSVGVGTALKYSSDLTTWTSASNSVAGLSDVVYANGKFVAVGIVSANSFCNILTSTDGVSWTTETTSGLDSLIVPSGTPFAKLSFSNGYYILASTTSNTYNLYLSENATNWYLASSFANGVIRDMKSTSVGVLIAAFNLSISYNGQKPFRMWSYSGAITKPGGSTAFNCLNYGNGKLWIGTNAGTSGYAQILSSDDGGVTWSSEENQTLPQGQIYARSYFNGAHIILHSNGGIYRSTNLSTWVEVLAPASISVALAYAEFSVQNGILMSVGGWYSADGISWVSIGTATSNVKIIYFNGKYHFFGVLNGTNGVHSSSDLSSWTLDNSASFLGARSVDTNGNIAFLCGGTVSSYFGRTTDGITFTGISLSATQSVQCVKYFNGKFYAFWLDGSTPYVTESSDGVNWVNTKRFQASFGQSYKQRVDGSNSRMFVIGSSQLFSTL